MQVFTTPQPHEFSIDGRKFYLPAITMRDFEVAQQIDKLLPAERIQPFRDFLTGRARPAVAPWWFGRSRGRRGALRLDIVQLTELWQGWVGMPGEASSSSRTSSASDETSSPEISVPSTPRRSGKSKDTSSQS